MVELFQNLSDCMWASPVHEALHYYHSQEQQLQSKIQQLHSPGVPGSQSGSQQDHTEDTMAKQEASFDPDKMVSCTVENGHTLVHGAGGRGYGLGATAITSGCYQWKFLIVKENKGNEGTCVGVSKWPVRDFSHRTTSDMWLYRAYSGNLYHNGEQSLTLPGYTQGDYITCILDMDARTLAFGKNGEVRTVQLLQLLKKCLPRVDGVEY